jgi:hypothetical protein
VARRTLRSPSDGRGASLSPGGSISALSERDVRAGRKEMVQERSWLPRDECVCGKSRDGYGFTASAPVRIRMVVLACTNHLTALTSWKRESIVAFQSLS